MQRFEFIDTPIQGLELVQRQPLYDARGFLSRLFCAETFASFGFEDSINQINHTLTIKSGTVRGMHYQMPPHAETKLITCIRGEIFDVAVDLRQGSPTFLQWHGEILSETNQRSLLIPKGFAHGFQALRNDCELIYLHSTAYVPVAEAALNAQDPMLAIDWPREIVEMSERDRSHPMLKRTYEGIET